MTRIGLRSLFLMWLVVAGPVPAWAQWTAVGSTGTVDDASKDIYDTTTSAIQILSSAPLPATLDVRYNVVEVEGVAGPVVLRVRYRDNSGGGRVLARLRQVNLSTGVNTILAVVDSETFGTSGDFQLRADTTCPVAVDFVNNAYYVDVRLEKWSAGALPAVQAIQVRRTLCIS